MPSTEAVRKQPRIIYLFLLSHVSQRNKKLFSDGVVASRENLAPRERNQVLHRRHRHRKRNNRLL